MNEELFPANSLTTNYKKQTFYFSGVFDSMGNELPLQILFTSSSIHVFKEAQLLHMKSNGTVETFTEVYTYLFSIISIRLSIGNLYWL